MAMNKEEAEAFLDKFEGATEDELLEELAKTILRDNPELARTIIEQEERNDQAL